MKKWIGYLALVAFLGIPANALIEKDRQELEPQSVLPNGGFESGKRSWNITGASTLTIDTSTPLLGKASGQWDASASGEFLRSDLITVPEFLHGRNCEIKFGSTFSGTSGDVTANVNDGTNDLLTAVNVPVTSTALPTSLNFICPTSGGVRLELESTADAAVVELDQVYMGLATNLHETSSSKIALDAVYETTASCTWSVASTTQAAFNTDADCPAITVKSAAPGVVVDTTDDDLPTLIFTSLNPGKYVLNVYFTAGLSSAGNDGTIYIKDNTDSVVLGQVLLGNVSAGSAFDGAALQVTFTQTVAGPRSIAFEGAATAGSIQLFNFTATAVDAQTRFVLTQYPLESQTALTVEQSGWHIDVNIGGTVNPSLGVGNVSSYTGLTSTGADLVINPGSQNAQIACETTNPSTGLTCTGGTTTESMGLQFDIPFAGKYKSCFQFGHKWQGDNGSELEVTFQIVETTNTSQAILQEGNGRVISSYESASTNLESGYPFNVCGVFEFASAGPKTLRLMYEQEFTTLAPDTSVLLINRDTGKGQYDMHITVQPITQNVAHPVILNSVTTTDSGGVKVVSAFLSGSATITRQDGTWIDSITDNGGTGDYTVNFTAGTFSGPPNCQCTVNQSLLARGCSLHGETISEITVKTYNSNAGASQDSNYYLTCVGPK